MLWGVGMKFVNVDKNASEELCIFAVALPTEGVD